MGFFDMLDADQGIYGRKPTPIAAPTPEEILEDATLANLANVGNVNKLAATQNEFNLDEALKEFEKVAPGVFPQLVKNITASVRGEVSEGTRNQIARGVAERGVDRGTSGSIFDENDFLRHLGITSVAEQQRGQNNFQSLMKGALPNLFDTSQSFLKPTYDPYAEFQNQIYNEKIAAAPDPAKAGQAAAHVAFMESIGSMWSGTPHSAGSSRPSSPDGPDTQSVPTSYYPQNANGMGGMGGSPQGWGGGGSVPGGSYGGGEAFDEYGTWNF